MELCFPCASCLMHLPSIFPSIPDAYFWLVVVFQIINWHLSKASVYFIYIIFDQVITPNNGTVSPHALPRPSASALTSPLPLQPTIGLIVGCRH